MSHPQLPYKRARADSLLNQMAHHPPLKITIRRGCQGSTAAQGRLTAPNIGAWSMRAVPQHTQYFHCQIWLSGIYWVRGTKITRAQYRLGQ